ncbi:hypothetical protein DRQ36_03570 [bacterium]|nr:MAG: hypothetical protein DRQ36_03570 [bacterium]
MNRIQEDFWHVDWDKEFTTELSEEELGLFDKVAEEVAKRQLVVPALMLIESLKPLNWIGSQFMLLVEPFTVYIFDWKQLRTLRRALQKRDSMEELAKRIEEADIKYGPKKKRRKKKELRSSDG